MREKVGHEPAVGRVMIAPGAMVTGTSGHVSLRPQSDGQWLHGNR